MLCVSHPKWPLREFTYRNQQGKIRWCFMHCWVVLGGHAAVTDLLETPLLVTGAAIMMDMSVINIKGSHFGYCICFHWNAKMHLCRPRLWSRRNFEMRKFVAGHPTWQCYKFPIQLHNVKKLIIIKLYYHPLWDILNLSLCIYIVLISSQLVDIK